MLATVSAATLRGVDGSPVTVEVHIANGLPGFTIVGLPDATCREARDRVRAALLTSGLPWPTRKVTVNLAPSALRKVGAGLDLAVAVGVLVAEGHIRPEAVEGIGFLAELGLDGRLRSIAGALSLVDALDAATVIVAPANVAEAALVGRHTVRTANTIAELADVLRGEAGWPSPPERGDLPDDLPQPDLAAVRGQALARKALEVAAAGNHHLLMIGSPGAGKTMLARRLPGLLPSLAPEIAIDVTRIHSAAGLALPPGALVELPPFRAPHHGATAVALVGGGTGSLRPGEISCAHGGVLFLDELGEFAPVALDALRQPLEEGTIRVSRSAGSATFPARFLLVAAMNPCPCGEPGLDCHCTEAARLRYQRRLSGPLLDRFDLRITVNRPSADDLLRPSPAETTAAVGARVLQARRIANERGVLANADLSADELALVAPFGPSAERMVEDALRSRRLSARGLHRIRSVALTLADLGGREPPLDEADVAQALQMRVDPRTADRGLTMAVNRP